VLAAIERSVGAVVDLGPLGRALAVVLGVWRHDRLFGTARSTTLGTVVTAAVGRVLWLAEGVRGGPAPADLDRIAAVAAARDAVLHAGLDRDPALSVMARLAADPGVPPDLRGAALGFGWSLGAGGDAVRSVRGAAAPTVLGDWLAGLFALAREEVLAEDAVLGILDDLIGAMAEHDFLVALPALRQAFAFFPPRERETIARRLLDRRGLARTTPPDVLRLDADPVLVAEAHALEARVDGLLRREGLR
jgi:hypothetical protein